ncbi:MAG: ribonuclease J [Nannocystales bacterium]
MREPGPRELFFVPLGGSGEIGMNLNLYGHDGRWLMIDCGITFEQENGVTHVLMPNVRFAHKRRKQLEALVITHAHEDHLGAVVHLWDQLQCPVYATPFAAAVLRRKIGEADIEGDLDLRIIDCNTPLDLGPFTLEFVDVTHSTVESQAILVGTPVGTVLHTGDFKLDPDPLVGPSTDLTALGKAADRNIVAAVSDSTNATKDVSSRSEAELRDALVQRLERVKTGRIAVACFSSNIARIDTFIKMAAHLERHPVLLGRSLRRMVGCARETEYLSESEMEIEVRDFGYLPPSKLMLICTGTQGEPGSAMDRISRDDHRDISFERGDLVLFSSKIIPGNEDGVHRLHSQLRGRGVEVVSENEEFVHVSGHPGRPELRRVYELAQPASIVPVHGEERHMTAHAELATEMGLPSVVPFNGAVVQLVPGPPKIIDKVEHGRTRVPGRESGRRPPRHKKRR